MFWEVTRDVPRMRCGSTVADAAWANGARRGMPKSRTAAPTRAQQRRPHLDPGSGTGAARSMPPVAPSSAGTCMAESHKMDRSGRSYPPPPLYKLRQCTNYYGPYAHCSLDKGVACAKQIQLLTQTCARAWYRCTLTSAHISKCMQTQDSLGNMKTSVSHQCWHKQ